MLQAIIGGSLKGTKLTSLTGKSVRPTAARVREAVFNILGNRVVGCSFVDVFAGNGGMGLEAISRGARDVTLVEKDPKAAKVIQANLDHAEGRYRGSAFAAESPWPEATVVPRDAFRAGLAGPFDIVWLDPPYALFGGQTPQIVELALSLVADDGMILLESDESGAKAIEAFCAKTSEERKSINLDQRRYGKSYVSLISTPHSPDEAS